MFDMVPESAADLTTIVYSAEGEVDGGIKPYIRSGSLVVRSISEARKFFGPGRKIYRVHLPPTASLYWRRSSQGVYSEVHDLPDGICRYVSQLRAS